MAPPTWTTPEEREFVVSRLQAFLSASREGRAAQDRWWDCFFREWFAAFPTLKALIDRGDLPSDAHESTLDDGQRAIFGAEISEKRKVRTDKHSKDFD